MSLKILLPPNIEILPSRHIRYGILFILIYSYLFLSICIYFIYSYLFQRVSDVKSFLNIFLRF